MLSGYMPAHPNCFAAHINDPHTRVRRASAHRPQSALVMVAYDAAALAARLHACVTTAHIKTTRLVMVSVVVFIEPFSLKDCWEALCLEVPVVVALHKDVEPHGAADQLAEGILPSGRLLQRQARVRDIVVWVAVGSTTSTTHGSNLLHILPHSAA